MGEFLVKEGRGYVLVVDGNAPWVRWLFSELPGARQGGRQVVGCRVLNAAAWLGWPKGWRESWSTVTSCGWSERKVLIPGWRRFGWVSTTVLRGWIGGVIRRWGEPEAIVYTLPQYAAVAERMGSRRQVYYAYDPYACYGGWDGGWMESLERKMLSVCSAAFAVSRELVKDLEGRSEGTPVFYSPNAAERGLAARVREAAGGAVPEELRDVRGRIVGCIGRVDPQGYWWDLVEGLSAFFPDVTFVFVGGLTGRSGVARERALRALGRRNVRWVGEKAHKELPRYLARFDLCLNPMAVTEANDRRSFLRLYDYLATEKPILSSAVREAKEHEGHVVIGREVQECVVLLGEMLDGAKPVQREQRRRYAELNTWERRAAVLWERVGEVCA